MPIRWAKVRSKYLLKPKSEVISLSESQVQKYGLSMFLDFGLSIYLVQILVELLSKQILRPNFRSANWLNLSQKVKSRIMSSKSVQLALLSHMEYRTFSQNET